MILYDIRCNKLISVTDFSEYVVLSLTLGLITRSAVAVAYYTTVQRRWEIKNIFENISTWSTESMMGLTLAIIPSIIYMVSKMSVIFT
jgi:hypothetical protein